ncbi:complex I 24 kDa subunit family protein [Magnetospirillum molischianum]|uniref:NADH-quinone oxidoreductase chain E (NADH dehydrogenase I, chain E) (NDH-1, chain E) n=1 Tax=Magnetospirillum molischianum DSM 120 TaxID=1150626 RepID=H8FSM2_MAGML|nr:NAD(P)H-dependent oxidoreductase subunit E [Magnetospirillum molischianum]CCG41360.1 NADH-quinone oxidoreductase chain E (NADH dehydrogenase I, chain E) (NDH-1, chain E) [Magnetospirillum molischianum DSM 120]
MSDSPAEPAAFAFTPESAEQARAFIARYPAGRQQSAVMPLLDLAQRQEGWVSRAAIEMIANMLEMAPIQVEEVATFYTMYNRRPVGRFHVQICTNLPCMLRGSDAVIDTVCETLGIGVGETTPDGLFTVSEAECLGACVNAPVIQINDDYYEDLDPTSTRAVLEALGRGETPRTGSQTGRQTSCPAGGPTTLIPPASATESA